MRDSRLERIESIRQKAKNVAESPQAIADANVPEYRLELARANRARVFEARIQESDLLRINYLQRGVVASRAVCRLDIRNRSGRTIADGTGFLVSSSLLMTNAHVLLDEEEATSSLAEFDYEDDLHSLPKRKRIFALRGDQFWFRDEDYDLALVAVAATDLREEKALTDYGYLRLRARAGKAEPNERVTIIQHPDGRSKEIACRGNRVTKREGILIKYKTDTEPGSSGAPVFSDEWELVALHHAGVRKTRDGRPLNREGGFWTEDQGEEAAAWEENEGIRVSSIAARLKEHVGKLTNDIPVYEEAGDLERLARARREVPLLKDAIRQADSASGPVGSSIRMIETERRNRAWYEAAEGYDQDFLGPDSQVPLPDHSAHPNTSQELLYRNFSVVMDRTRRQALFTAVNIDGVERVNSSRDIGWKLDPRLDSQFQLENDFYRDSPSMPNGVNLLDRGHLVKRTDPSWGDLGAQAIDDTFHWTNSALQHRSFNNGMWGRLEDALEGRFIDRTIMSVFTGPVLHNNDPPLEVPLEGGGTGRTTIPLEFWKVIVFADAQGFFTAAGFRQSQENLLTGGAAAARAGSSHAELVLHQVPISEIEDITGLGFHDLADFEASNDQLESRREGFRKLIRRPEDLTLVARSGRRRPTRKARAHYGAGESPTGQVAPPPQSKTATKPRAKKAASKGRGKKNR